MPVWNPHLKGDIEELENIQHRGDKACARLKKKVEYMERLRKLRLTRLETGRKRGDLIQFFKIVHVLDHVNMETRSRFVLGLHNNILFTRFIAGFLRRKSYMHALSSINQIRLVYLSGSTFLHYNKMCANSFPSKP